MATLLDPDVIDLGYALKLREHVATVPIENQAILNPWAGPQGAPRRGSR